MRRSRRRWTGPVEHEARRHPPHHRDHRRRAGRTSTSTPACSACGWSRRPSTRTTRPSTTSSTPTSRAAPAPTSPSSSIPGAPAGPRRRRHGPHDRLAGRLRRGARLLGRAARRRRASTIERDGDTAALRRPRGPRATSSGSRDVADEPLIADHPEIPAEHRAAGLRRRRAPTPRPRAQRAAARGGARLRARRDDGWEARGDEPRRPRTPTTSRPPSAALQGAGTVHHVAWASTMEEHEAWRERAIAGGRPPDAGDRPLLLPLDLLPRAERRAVRDRHARPRLHGRRAAGDASARSSRCRPTTSTCASRSRRT